MSRFIKTAGESSTPINAQQVCNISSSILTSFCDCSLQYELICSCHNWCACYGSSFAIELPTTQYNRFQIGFYKMEGAPNVQSSWFARIGTCNCFCACSINSLRYMDGIGCTVSLSTCEISGWSMCCDATKYQTSVEVSLWRANDDTIYFVNRVYPNTTLSCQVCGCSNNSNIIWQSSSGSSLQFTRFSICTGSSGGVKATNGCWYVYGVKNK